MKKIILFLLVLMQATLFAQNTQTIEKPLKLSSVAKGVAKDSVLLLSSSKLVKYLPVSELKIKTNLDYIATPTDGTVFSSTGNDAIIPLATEVNSGLLSPADKSRINTINSISTSLNLKEDKSNKNTANGYAGLDSGGKVPLSQINDVLLGSVNFKGAYNAATNTPNLPTVLTSTKGYYYVVSTAGTQAGLTLNAGDWVISNGTTWGKVDNNNAVTSVNSQVGAVNLTTANVDDSSGKRYQTDTQQTRNDATSSIQTQLNGKQNTLTNPLTGSNSNLDPNTYALQDGTILYHSMKWFVPTSTVSTSGTTVTSIGTQFLATMIGAKLIINGEWRIINAFTSTTVVTVSSAYSQNYSGIIAGIWGVYSKNNEITNTGNTTLYNYQGTAVFRNATSDLLNLRSQGFTMEDNSSGMQPNGFLTKANGTFRWSVDSNYYGAKDLGIRRNAGALEIFDGNNADGAVVNRRDLLARNLTSTGIQTFQGTTESDTAPLGSELATTATGTNWIGTGFATGYTHTVGSVVVLTSTLAAVSGTYYQITYTITGRTAGSIKIDYGATSVSGISATGNFGTLATSTNSLLATPTTDFDGTLVLSIKTIGYSSATTTFLNSAGAVSTEVRASNLNNNYFNGVNAGKRNTTGNGNTFIGSNTGVNNTSGINNTFIGSNTGTSNTYGIGNVAIGWNNLTSSLSGNYNTAIGGQQTLQYSTGSGNVAIGFQNFKNLVSGSGNTILGNQSGMVTADGTTPLTISNNSLFLGSGIKPLADNQANQVVIGYNATGLGSNTSVIGNSSTITTGIWGNLYLPTAPATSASTYDMLTRNTTTGIVEKKLSTDFATTAFVYSALSPYVPYLGATSYVNLGAYPMFANYFVSTGRISATGIATGSDAFSAESTSGKYFSVMKNFDNTASINLYNDLGTVNRINLNGMNGAATAISFIKSGGTSSEYLKADGSTSTLPYKVYTALLILSGSNVVATVLDNTLGTIVWTKNSTGVYVGTLAGAFTTNKTTYFATTRYKDTAIHIQGDNNTIVVGAMSTTSTPFIYGDVMGQIPIEIKVYN